jgi:hypothetical protein
MDQKTSTSLSSYSFVHHNPIVITTDDSKLVLSLVRVSWQNSSLYFCPFCLIKVNHSDFYHLIVKLKHEEKFFKFYVRKFLF